MANPIICVELTGAIDNSCIRSTPKKYLQEAVIINFNDIDKENSVVGGVGSLACDYTVQMVLKDGKKGVKVRLPDTGNSIKGYVNKSKAENGWIQYLHQIQLLLLGASAEAKCTMDKLDHGLYAVALQQSNGTVEIFGYDEGLSTADYTSDITVGGGGNLVVLQSSEDAQESMLPLIYKPAALGDANADFNEQFENV